MDAAGPPPAGPGGRGPGKEEEAAYAEVCGSAGAEIEARASGAAGGGAAAAAEGPAPAGHRPEAAAPGCGAGPGSPSSSSCPSASSAAGGGGAEEPAAAGGQTSSSSLGCESDEEAGAGRGAGGPSRRAPGGAPGAAGPHYISTQEIQLSEVDHDMDFDAGLAARWDFEDDNVIYSFVDYASFGSDETPGDTPTEEDNSCYLSTTPSERTARADSAGSGSEAAGGSSGSDAPRRPGGAGASPAGHILLSIKAASRAINECSAAREERDAIYAAEHEGDMSLRVAAAPERAAGFGQDAGRQHAKKFIAVPARLQTRCGAREAGGCSSGASSAVSELDDADKEVRNLTARAFRSLAYPYFDTLSLGSRASSASLSDHALGVNRWSTYLDLKCGALGPRGATGGGQLCVRSGKAPSRALQFVVSKLDGEIAHVEAPPPPRGTLGMREPGRAARPGEEEASKKSRFASSLLKNVISKKMQLEHEFKMERGELTDTSSAGPGAAPPAGRDPEPGAGTGGGGRPREGGVQRQSSRLSEGGSEHGAPPEEPGERGGGRSPASKASTPREGSQERAAAEEAAEARRGGSEAARATFLRSQHSAFRSWKEREAESKEERAPGGKAKPFPRLEPGEPAAGKATKLSRLFVPGIQHAAKEKEPAGQRPAAASPPAARPRLPEIKISLGPPAEPPFSIAQLLTPQLAARPPDTGHRAPRADGSDRVPQFLVRDVREGKGKAQAPLHQVRDVRKLIKGSHGGDSADNGSDRGSVGSEQGGAEHRQPGPAEAGSKAAAGGRALGCPPEGTVLVHRTSGRLPVATIAPNKSDPRQPAVLKIVAKSAAPWRHQAAPAPAEKGRGAEEDPREEGKAAPVQNALEKLTAAVRSMEELYSFSKREWKRKSDPLPITGSHVLSLIASQERDAAPRPPLAAEPTPKAEEPANKGPGPAGGERLPRRAANPAAAADKVSAKAAAFESLARQRQRGPAPPRALLTLRGPAAAAAAAAAAPPAKPPADGGVRSPAAAAATAALAPRAPRLPAGGGEGRAEPERSADCDGYLALPLAAARPGLAPAAAATTATAAGGGRPAPVPFGAAPPAGGPGLPSAADGSAAPPSPDAAAALFPPVLPPFAAAPPAPFFCFSPSVAAAEPLPQRRVLLDVSSGQYYLLDAPPQQPAKRRLFDPESGQYVEVPVPPPAVAPLPLPLSPLALNAGAFGAAYMLYPGLLPAAAVLPAGALPRPLSHPGSEGSGAADPGSPAEPEGPYYVPGGQGPAARRGAAEAKPLVSITAPGGGSRLVAPPSFDGTTMRLVVEHR